MGQQALHFRIVTRAGAGLSVQSGLTIIRSNLILKLSDRLARVSQRVGLAIESLHPMTTDATALVKQILAQVQGVRALRHAVVRVAHLAAGFGIFFVKQGMQPERILAVSFDST